MMEKLKSFWKGSAPGPSGIRAEHLIFACCEQKDDSLFSPVYLAFINRAARGDLPALWAPYFGGARLIALSKGLDPTGGVRPIAVGEVPRRHVAKLVVGASLDLVRSHLCPAAGGAGGAYQVGVGVSNGIEAITRALRVVREAHRDEEDYTSAKSISTTRLTLSLASPSSRR